MKKLDSLAYFLSGFIATSLFLIFIILPQYTNKSVWQNYHILAVPVETPNSALNSLLKNADIHGYASEECIPDRFSFLTTRNYQGFPFTPVEHYKRWFTGTQAEPVRYIYIPDTSFGQYLRLYFMLRASRMSFYLEQPIPFSLIQLCGALLLVTYCLFKIQKKALFAALTFPFVLFSAAARGSFPMAATLLAIFSAAYWLEALGGEADIPWKQLKNRMRKNCFMFLLPVGALFFAIFSGITLFFLFLLSILLAAVTVFLVYRFLYLYTTGESTESHHQFKIVVMHPDSWKHFWNTSYTFNITVLTALLIFATAILPLLLSSNTLPYTIRNISVPAPRIDSKAPFTDDGFFTACIQRSDFSLPDLASYIEDHWYAAALPYMNINEPFTPVSKNAVIQLTSFRQQQNGALKPENHILYTFNTDFILHILKNESLVLNPLEQMLIAQNGFFTVEHKNITLYRFNKIVTCCITLAALFFPCILIIMARRQ